MRLAGTKDVLVRAEILAPTSLASGFPLWLPFGTEVARRFDKLYREALGSAIDFVELEPPLLVDFTRYESLTTRSYAYTNMFAVELEGESQLVRPDALVTTAASLRESPTHVPVLLQGGFYRAETGTLRPLVRDRHVWRVTQVVHWVGDEAEGDVAAMHVEIFRRFMARLGLPTLYVDSPPLRQHSRRRVLSYACPAADEVTLTSTLYVLTEWLSQGLGLEGTVIDFGFTSKLLACAAAVHADDSGYLCTSSLAPQPVVIGMKDPAAVEEADRLLAQIQVAEPRAVVDSEPWHRTLRISRRRGTPVLVRATTTGEAQLIRRIDSSSVPLPRDAASAVADALRAHDQELMSRARRVVEEALLTQQAIRLGDEVQPDGWFSLGTFLGLDEIPAKARSAPPHLLAHQKRLY